MGASSLLSVSAMTLVVAALRPTLQDSQKQPHPLLLPDKRTATTSYPRCNYKWKTAPHRTKPALMKANRLPRGGPPNFDPSTLIGPAILAALIASGALWNILSFINGVFLLIFLLPLVGGPIFNWYLKNNLLEGTCPDCGFPQQILKGTSQHQCLNCGSIMSSELGVSGVFMRQGLEKDGVVDVDVIN